MARPFDSPDSPLMRQQPFSQYGGAATRDPRLQLPKTDASAGSEGPQNHLAFLMQMLQHPALGPILRQFLMASKPSDYHDAVQRLRQLLEPTSLDNLNPALRN